MMIICSFVTLTRNTYRYNVKNENNYQPPFHLLVNVVTFIKTSAMNMLKPVNSLILLCLLFFVCNCNSQQQYDPDLEKPDIDNAGMMHGYNYTFLGCLVSFPWEWKGERLDSSADYISFSITSKIEAPKSDLVFELEKNGTLKYWFKKDYLVNPVDTITQMDGVKAIMKNRRRSDGLSIKIIYNGTWQYNQKDSSVKIDFGKNEFGLLPVEGRIYLLSIEELCIQQPVSLAADSAATLHTPVVRMIRCFVH